MQPYSECPQVLRDFLSYHESIKGQSRRTVSEYHLDLRMFLRFLTLMRKELPYQTPLDEIDIKWIDASVLNTVSSSEVFDFLSYLTNDRQNREGYRLMSGSRPLPARGSCRPLRHSISI